MKNSQSNCNQSGVAAWFEISSEGRLCLRFLKASMTKDYINKHFGMLRFKIMVAFDLPESTASKIGLASGKRRIVPGVYPVKETGEQLIVEF